MNYLFPVDPNVVKQNCLNYNVKKNDSEIIILCNNILENLEPVIPNIFGRAIIFQGPGLALDYRFRGINSNREVRALNAWQYLKSNVFKQAEIFKLNGNEPPIPLKCFFCLKRAQNEQKDMDYRKRITLLFLLFSGP